MYISNPYDPRKILAHPQKLKSLLMAKIPYPITIEVDPVDRSCNLHCSYCCFGGNVEGKPVFIKSKPLIDALGVAAGHGTKAVELVGGTEPTMHEDIQHIARNIAGLGLEMGLITNGVLLSRIFSVADTFVYIRISLDAGTPKTYYHLHGVDCFDRVVENIERLISTHTDAQRVGLAYLCLPQNTSLKEMLLAVELGARLNLSYVVFRPAVLPSGWDPKYLDTVEAKIAQIQRGYGNQINIFSSVSGRWALARNQKREYSGPCLTRALTGIIMADGNVPFCNLFRRKGKFHLGNIYRESFEEIWEGENHRKLSELINTNNCPIPCKADDYRKALFAHKGELLGEDFHLPEVAKKAHPNFV